MTVVGEPIDRRAFLAGAAGVTAGSAGCLGRFQASVDRDTPEQVSLALKTVPADEDGTSVRIARHLSENLERAGIDASVQPVTTEQLLRDVLINHDFDLYVGQHPGFFDPDYLYGLLHSRFIEEEGWQNPFGYANVSGVDELLTEQRYASDRIAVLEELRRVLLEEFPLSVVAYPDEPRAIREDRYSGWGAYRSLERPLGYLALEAHEEANRDGVREANTLYMGITDRRVTRNRNPFAVEFRHRGIITGLMYDPLGQPINGSIEPWLARDWQWDDSGPTIRLHLRDGLTWHDGEALTAADVAFTYRFLADTTMTSDDPVVPAPRFRSRSSLVESVEVTGNREVEISLVASREEVGLRALTVPIVPMHVWEEQTELTSITGVDRNNVTEALIWDNPEPVGSGALRYADAIADERLELERFDDHFLMREEVDDALAAFAGGPPYERILFLYSPSQANLIELVQAGNLDATTAGLTATEIPRADQASNVSLRVESTSAHYHVGFNARNAPLSNPRFRRAVGRLIDREYLRTEVFDGFAIPALSPLGPRSAVEDGWRPGSEQGFAGQSGTATIDEETAYELFREAGYTYNEENELVAQQ